MRRQGHAKIRKRSETMEWYLMVWRRYAEFTGRSRRKEYWMFTLFNMIFYLLVYIPGLVVARQSSVLALVFFGVAFLYGLAGLVPGLAVTVRRLHDTGKSAWWILIALIPLAGLALLIFLCLDSDPGDNRYGPNPKASEPFLAIS
jgi:uncharacterized membrane protein YhaH (DUF805 family)